MSAKQFIGLRLGFISLLLSLTFIVVDAQDQFWGGVFTEEDVIVDGYNSFLYEVEPFFTENDIIYPYRIYSVNPPEVIYVDPWHELDKSFPQPDKFVTYYPVTIPETVQFRGVEYTVVGIGPNNFQKNPSLCLPSTLRFLDRAAIKENREFEQLVLPEGLRFIHDYNLSYMALREIEIPSSVRLIEKACFSHNSKLEKITFNHGLYKIGNNSFSDNEILEEVVLPASVRDIGDGSFCSNPNLKRVVLPRWLWSAVVYDSDDFLAENEGVFNKCPNISEIEITSHKNYFPYQWFNDVDPEKCTIIVPDGEYEYFRGTERLKKFKTIIEKSEYEASKVGIESVTEGSAVPDGIYTLSGLPIADGSSLHDGEIFIRVTDGISEKIVK